MVAPRSTVPIWLQCPLCGLSTSLRDWSEAPSVKAESLGQEGGSQHSEYALGTHPKWAQESAQGITCQPRALPHWLRDPGNLIYLSELIFLTWKWVSTLTG